MRHRPPHRARALLFSETDDHRPYRVGRGSQRHVHVRSPNATSAAASAFKSPAGGTVAGATIHRSTGLSSVASMVVAAADG